ncbi:MAG: hypothetical protein IH934_02875 [Nanoarchaeota archaeon]|nr:hypothetical protein [Nanoarchaeota archaeon]
MIFEENKTIEKIGEKLGYIFSYFLFTTILFFILVMLKKIPESWSYTHVMGIVILIALVGVIIKRFLK